MPTPSDVSGLEKPAKRGLRDRLRSKHEAHRTNLTIRRRMGPQAVPRGFLRMYMLSLMSRQPETGYSAMQHINEKTQGAWRPGPGTIYPLLKTMSKEGLIKPLGQGGREDSVAYSITAKGKGALDDMQREMVRRGSEGQAMMGLVGELFPPAHYTSFFTSHYRAEHALFAEKVVMLSRPERDLVLKEVELILERQLAWIKHQLQQKEV
jgi:DNA-binding PadR family transcriptional regulator